MDFVSEENDADIPLGDPDSDILGSDGKWKYETKNLKECSNYENVNNLVSNLQMKMLLSQ